MLRLSKKHDFKRHLYSKPVIAALLLPVGFMASAAWSAWAKEQSTKRNLAAVAAELEDLREREVALTAELDRLNTDRGLEAEIRRKFELGREGEEMIVIVDTHKDEPAPAPPPAPPWWQWWRSK